jgi:hypothetical protein
MDKLNEPGCWCMQMFCPHQGFRCGRAVAHKVKASVLLDDAKYGSEQEVGICEECWANIEQHQPELLKSLSS